MITANAAAASEALNRALITAASRGLRPHCRELGGEYWVSDQEGERRMAVVLCRGCAVVVKCREAADARDEQWHVWGGKDYTHDQDHNEQHDLGARAGLGVNS